MKKDEETRQPIPGEALALCSQIAATTSKWRRPRRT